MGWNYNEARIRGILKCNKYKGEKKTCGKREGGGGGSFPTTKMHRRLS